MMSEKCEILKRDTVGRAGDLPISHKRVGWAVVERQSKALDFHYDS